MASIGPMNYCIYCTPQCSELQKLQEIREHFDPLADHIPPHITLVFPFQFEGDLAKHVEMALRAVKPFKLSFDSVSHEQEDYVFLNVGEGKEAVVDAHDRLYAGPLVEYHREDIPYIPHVTLGRLSAQEFESNREHFEDVSLPIVASINTVVIEKILADDSSR